MDVDCPALPAGTLGLAAAVTAALLWAIGSMLYRMVGRVLPPVRLNLAKGLAASLLFAGVVGWHWWRPGAGPLAVPPRMLALLAASGVIGIGCGDTGYFAALNRLGPRRVLLLFTLAPVLTALLAWPLLDERPGALQAAGILLTCGGVGWVIAERTPGGGGFDAAGTWFGIGAALCQAVGSLLSRHVFEQTGCDAALSALVRILGGTAVLLLMLPLDRALRVADDQPGTRATRPGPVATWLLLGAAMFLGTFLGIWLQQLAFKLSDNVGVAATLLATSPLFILPLAAAAGERVSARAVAGAALSVLGVAVLLGALG